MANLLITAGPNAGKYFPLANRPLSAGRDPARDIQLLDPKVSRKHFVVRKAGDEYIIVPFKSVNAVHETGAGRRQSGHPRERMCTALPCCCTNCYRT